MGVEKRINDEEMQPLAERDDESRDSIDSTSTASISFALLGGANRSAHGGRVARTRKSENQEKYHDDEEEGDLEEGFVPPAGGWSAPRRVSVIFTLIVTLCIAGWLVAFFVLLGRHKDSSKDAAVSQGESNIIPGIYSGGRGGKKLDLDGVLFGNWSPKSHDISWFPGPNGADGLLLEQGGDRNKAYLRVEDIRSRNPGNKADDTIVLMRESSFMVGKRLVRPSKVWPSPDLKTVLVMSDQRKNWRHSYTGNYWLFDVETQTGEPLDPESLDGGIQLASWSPNSDAIVFTRKNNMFIRRLSSKNVKQITTDGGTNLFYGIPDWVYEEEVFSGSSATWWDGDGKFVAFLRTNESRVPEYPVQYFIPNTNKPSRPSEENYPDIRKIKYPKAGAPNPVVVDAPSAVDLKRGLVYFVAAKENPTERHIYTVKLDGSGLQPIVDTKSAGYYSISLSAGAGYALLKYEGPDIPWQKVISTPANEEKYEESIEKNPGLADMARKYALPSLHYQTITISGYELQVVERRPANFNPDKKYPVLFHLYGGPGSQTVTKKFKVDFQSYVASNLGYIVVTVDGRGTGFIGRKARCAVRGNLGHYEAIDQIETAKAWGKRSYVDADRMAIWGWSYGGFMTLKTLEQDAGQTFQYGMAVAPVTDWRFYDSIYTERYMHTPQNNPEGYDRSAISNVTALDQAVRFMIVHGSGDDNVHIQNTLTLLDKLDLGSVKNFDVHVYPDSDHSIYFHNANKMVYQRLSDWLVNAFNGEWVKTRDPIPHKSLARRALGLINILRNG
ncbi:dipeptidyl aminopeptidase B [Coccidioides immitis RMSCC 3703]|uniref:Probable dipeptidyl-aminopeptidase B n=1 Tax=Coccidioides immitis RMSCC 3703 TaxID=454286 RepID=A0A0J8R863_COCIT|nr:dipeptidyl aminopeptidase B [Coccidioides immitis RMSCC 3703]